MLIMSRKQGQCVCVGEDIRITIVRIDNQTVRIGIEAPGDVPVARGELMPGQPAPPDVEPICFVVSRKKPKPRPALATPSGHQRGRQEEARSAPITSSPSGFRSRQSSQRRTAGSSTIGIKDPR